MRTVRVAVVQDSPVVFDREATLDKARALINHVAERGVRLVLFPEGFVSAYPVGLDFGARFGFRRPRGRDDFKRYFDSAVEVPGPACDALAHMAKAAGVYLVMGVIERDGGTLYCSVLFFGPDGSYLGKHRKLMPTALERITWGFGDGSTMAVFDTDIGKIGAVICWENYMPMMRMHMYSQGVQIYCAPTADDLEVWHATMRHIAREGRCFVLGCCQYLTLADCPKDYSIEPDDFIAAGPGTVLMRGGSCIVGPMGDVLAGPSYDSPDILTADLDLDQIPRAKYDLDVVGHYARPDVFRLHVNTRPNRPVEQWVEEGDDPFT